MADDFTLQLGLDTSPAEKAIKKIERMLARISGTGAVGSGGGGGKGGGNIDNRRARAMQQVDTIQRKINRSFGEGSEQAARFNNQIARIRTNIGSTEKQKGFIKVAGDMRILREEVTATNASLKRQQRIISRGQQINEGFNSSLKNMARSYLSVFAVIEAGRAFFTMTRDLDSVQASMLAASGSAELAAQDFEFVQKVSRDLNVDLLTAAKGFQKIGAAMREGFTKDQIKEVFTSAAEAAVAFGLSVDDTEGVMRAFSQIASKGTVQAEELRGQLGDRLPGAFEMAAKSMGVTTDELNKLLKAGKVASKDFLPNFAKELRRVGQESGATSAGVNSLRGAQVQFNRSIQDTVLLFKELGAGEGMKGIFVALTDIIKGITPVVLVLATAFTAVFTVVKLLFAPFDALANLLGFSGGGLGAIIILLSSVLVNRLVLSLGATIGALFQTQVAAAMTAASLASAGGGATIAAGGMSMFTKSMIIAKAAARSLLVALGPIGIAFAALSFGTDIALGSGLLGGGSGPSNAASNTSTTNKTVITNIDAPITVEAGAGGEDVAVKISEELNRQLQFAPSS